MKNYLLIVAASFVFTLHVNAAQRIIAEPDENEGFYFVDDLNIPELVSSSAAKSYHIVFTTRHKGQFENFLLYRAAALDHQIKRTWSMVLSRHSHRGDDAQYIADYSYLVAQSDDALDGDVVNSYFFYTDNDCTAFATDEGFTLWTAGHCTGHLAGNGDMTWAQTPLDPTSERFIFVFDAFGNSVAGPLALKDIQISMSLSSIDHSAKNIDVDFVSFRLKKALPYSLKVGPPVKPLDSIFAIGLPTGTGPYDKTKGPANYDRGPGKNSEGDALMMTRGSVLAPEDVTEILQPYFNGDRKFLFHLIHSFVTTADGAPGMSGGPVVNQYGEVVGISSIVMMNDITSDDGLLPIGRKAYLGAARPPEWKR